MNEIIILSRAKRKIIGDGKFMGIIFYEVIMLLIGAIIIIIDYDNLYLLACGVIIVLFSGVSLYRSVKEKRKQE